MRKAGLIAISALVLAASCGGKYQSAQLNAAGAGVQVAKNVAADPRCKLLGQVEARSLNPGIRDALYNELRNKTAALGGNLVIVGDHGTAYALGDAYACPRGGPAPGSIAPPAQSAPPSEPTPSAPPDTVPPDDTSPW